MIGCRNVLSRVKNSGVRIVLPVIDEFLCPKFSTAATLRCACLFPVGPEEEDEMTQQGVAPHFAIVMISLRNLQSWSILNSSVDFFRSRLETSPAGMPSQHRTTHRRQESK